MLDRIRKWWSAATRPTATEPPPAVIVHDPDAAKPHDLDDPFFDQKIQERVGSLIAGAAKKK